MKPLLLILLLLSTVQALTKQQRVIYNLVLQEAPKYTKYKSTLASICLTESSLGYYLIGDGGKSLGPMQIQVATVIFIAKRDKSLGYLLLLTKKRIASLLLSDTCLSIEIACKLFEYHRKRHGFYGAISRYNGGANNSIYYNRVIKNRQKLKGLL